MSTKQVFEATVVSVNAFEDLNAFVVCLAESPEGSGDGWSYNARSTSTSKIVNLEWIRTACRLIAALPITGASDYGV